MIILGGEIGGLAAGSGSVVDLLGGAFGGVLDLTSGSDIHFYGTEFLLNGAPIDGLLPGQSVTIDVPRLSYQELSGRLMDGTQLVTWLENEFGAQTARLTLTMPTAADFDGDQDVDATDLARWQLSLGSSGWGDADGDYDSDGADFLTWQRQYGIQCRRQPRRASLSQRRALWCWGRRSASCFSKRIDESIDALDVESRRRRRSWPSVFSLAIGVARGDVTSRKDRRG